MLVPKREPQAAFSGACLKTEICGKFFLLWMENIETACGKRAVLFCNGSISFDILLFFRLRSVNSCSIPVNTSKKDFLIELILAHWLSALCYSFQTNGRKVPILSEWICSHSENDFVDNLNKTTKKMMLFFVDCPSAIKVFQEHCRFMLFFENIVDIKKYYDSLLRFCNFYHHSAYSETHQTWLQWNWARRAWSLHQVQGNSFTSLQRTLKNKY